MTKWHVDKLIMHICALTLHIDNFETDIHDLQEDLRLETAKMSHYYLELGCRVAGLTMKEKTMRKLTKEEAKTHRIAKLQFPLQFPKQKARAMKKR